MDCSKALAAEKRQRILLFKAKPVEEENQDGPTGEKRVSFFGHGIQADV
jgi:hypothetical protein